jgi:hypothetical protein
MKDIPSRFPTQAIVCLFILAGAISQTASAQLALSAPANFRVDPSWGTTGQLLLSWTAQSGATYIVQRAESASGPWTTIGCGLSGTLPSDSTPNSEQVCRDNDAGIFLRPYTLYYYQVQACPASGSCTAYSTNQNYTYASDCLPSQIPSQEQQGRIPPSPTPVMLNTSAVTPNASYALNNKEIVAFANPAPTLTPVPIPYQNNLLVWLPGSDEFADFEPLMWTAVNLGFDAISVNYESYYDQEAICMGSNFSGSDAASEAAACFGNITQAKLNLTGPCIATANPFPTTTLCGIVPAGGNGPSPSGGPYYLTNIWDAVIPRITTMLQYLCSTPEYEITPGYLGSISFPEFLL